MNDTPKKYLLFWLRSHYESNQSYVKSGSFDRLWWSAHEIIELCINMKIGKNWFWSEWLEFKVFHWIWKLSLFPWMKREEVALQHAFLTGIMVCDSPWCDSILLPWIEMGSKNLMILSDQKIWLSLLWLLKIDTEVIEWYQILNKAAFLGKNILGKW